jgi:2-polyprenyl-3-methyl-5-hydroxy-6-metoxy-1,4-benzoquinol methylase
MINEIKKILPQFIINKIEALIEALVAKSLNPKFEQIISVLNHEAQLPPLPPKHLQVRVVGGFVPDFIESGSRVYDEMNSVLKPVGKQLKDFQYILDFGCGCGRIIRAMKTRLPHSIFCGTNIDNEAIKWLKKYYKKYGEYDINPYWLPSVYGENQFDFIYCISVFTHLPEDLQFAWLEELKRISKPGAYLICTTHGKKHYEKIRGGELEIILNKGFLYLHEGKKAWTNRLPDFYQTAYHSTNYIRNKWSNWFSIIDIKELARVS